MYKYLKIKNQNDYDEAFLYYIKTKKNSNLNSFLKMAQVKKGSYAARIVEKMFNRYAKYAVSLKKEYHKYYSKEFDSFSDYLKIRHKLFKKEICYFKKHNCYYTNLNDVNEYNVQFLIEDEFFLNLFNDFFGESFNEN